MNINNLKYKFESALQFAACDRFVFRISDLDELKNIPTDLYDRLSSCHIYFICKRPRIWIEPNSIKIQNENLFFNIQCRVKGSLLINKVNLAKDTIADQQSLIKESNYPHRELLVINELGNVEKKILISNLVHLFPEIPNNIKDLEVVYIGKGVKNTATKRLENHSTLQKILADISSKEPDNEVFALTYFFEKPKKPLMAFPDYIKPNKSSFESFEHLKKIRKLKLSIELQISLIEATLISYFKTNKYNTHYLDFPNRDTQNLKKIIESDFAAIIVSISNENIGYQNVFSEAIDRNHTHHVVIDFRTKEGFFQPFPSYREDNAY